MKGFLLTMMTVFLGWATSCVTVPSIEDEARETLFAQLRESTSWQRIHAAEEISKAGILSEEVTEIFEAEYAASRPYSDYRIGCIRVLYRNCPEKRAALRAELLENAYAPGCGGDVHAVETMGKLAMTLLPEELDHLRPYLKRGDQLDLYSLPVFFINQDAEGIAIWQERMDKQDNNAASAAIFMDEVPEVYLDALKKARFAVGGNDYFQVFALHGYLKHCDITNADHFELWRRIEETAPAAMRRFYINAVGDIGDEGDRARLRKYLKDEDGEIRIAAAGSILRITNRCNFVGK